MTLLCPQMSSFRDTSRCCVIVDNKLICNKDPEFSEARATFVLHLPLIEAAAVSHDNQPAKPEQLQLFFSSRYLNIEQVAEIIGVPKSFIYRRTARGHDDPIPHYRLGGHLRFKLDDIRGLDRETSQ